MLAFLGVLALIYTALCAFLFFTQRSMTYLPRPRTVIDGTTMLTLPVDGAEVLVTTLPQAGAKALLYFGGNAEDCRVSRPRFPSRDLLDALSRLWWELGRA